MFRQTLQIMVDRIEGGVAGVMMGFDGIAVESYTRDGEGVDIQTLGMEFSHIIAQVRKAGEMLELGEVTELVIKSQKLTVIVHALNDEYFLACALKPQGNQGKARYVVGLTVPQIQAEL